MKQVTNFEETIQKEWVVYDPMGDNGKYQKAFDEIRPEDASIFTIDMEEVIGCSEWMRVDQGIFDYIVDLHNSLLRSQRDTYDKTDELETTQEEGESDNERDN